MTRKPYVLTAVLKPTHRPGMFLLARESTFTLSHINSLDNSHLTVFENVLLQLTSQDALRLDLLLSDGDEEDVSAEDSLTSTIPFNTSA